METQESWVERDEDGNEVEVHVLRLVAGQKIKDILSLPCCQDGFVIWEALSYEHGERLDIVLKRPKRGAIAEAR